MFRKSFAIILLLMIVLTSRAQQTAPGTEGSAYAAHSVLSSGKWAKVRVSDTGISCITREVASAAGFSDISKVKVYGYGGAMIPEILTQKYLQEHDDLHEVPVCNVGGKLYFFAVGPVNWNAHTNTQRVRNPYSNYGYYFLTQDDSAQLACTEEDLLKQANNDYSRFYTLYENDKFAWSQTGRELFDGKEIKAGASNTFNVTVPLNSDAQAVPDPLVTCIVSAGSESSVSVSVGTLKRSLSLRFVDYDVANVATTTFNVTSEVMESEGSKQPDGSWILPVTVTCNTGGPIRLDYIQVNLLNAADVAPLAARNYPAAEFVGMVGNQDRHADDVKDNIIIIPASQKLREQAQELGELHLLRDGMTYRIVPADELYNEFSSGTPDLSAYRRYLKMFYDRAGGDRKKMPKHVILFGDAVWDSRMNTLPSATFSVDDYLLCYETPNSYSTLSSYATDDFITILQDGKTLHSLSSSDKTLEFDIAVGRIPVTTPDAAKKVVDKIKHYVSDKSAGSWQNEIMFIGDDGDNNSHMRNINANADSVIVRNPGYHVKKVMADAYELVSTSVGDRFPEVEAIVKKQQNDGALVMNYGGHASWVELSHENILTLSDFSNFRGDNYSLWFTAACETVPFDMTTATLGEESVLNANGGAIAFYGTTRTVLESLNSKMNISFMRHVLSYDTIEVEGVKTLIPVTIGEAQRRAKNSMVKGDYPSEVDRSINKHNYVLIGDPAMSLALPQAIAVIDEINGVKTGGKVELKGNSVVFVKGHIASRCDSSRIMNTFNGTAHVLVRDSKQLVVCHDEESPFTFYNRTGALFNGTCSVKDGEFWFAFRVPRDIYNDGKEGLITVFADGAYKAGDGVERMMTANGENSDFSVLGWEEAANDSVGPSIYCYLNSTNFNNGDDVGRTPFFVAEVTDNDGINTTGASIGHNLELVIDGDASMTYDLNENFQFDYGTYVSGRTHMVLPELQPGNHSLTFKAWDLLNNSNYVTLDFRVVRAMKPDLVDVTLSRNPVRGEVTFYVQHDMNGSEADLIIEIIDASGRVVQTNAWHDTLSANGVGTSYKWSSEGIAPGLYLYRVKLSCDGSDYVSKTKKLIVAQ